MKISRINRIVFLGIALSALILLQGCGASDRLESAPDGSTITFDPSSTDLANIPKDVCVSPVNVILRYPDGTPFPRGVLNISGGFAVPNLSGSGLYQFFSAPNCGGTAVNSGFQAQTDVKGIYSFSILVPALVTGTTTTNAFTDKLIAVSGTAVGSFDFTLK